MDIAEFTLQDLIKKVYAQSGDTVAQPTFGTLETGGGSTSLATVTLTASSTATGVGDTFTVDVQIATNNSSIREYQIVVTFDPARLSVVDANPSLPGNQIEFLDSVFDVAPEDNIVESGKITLIAKTPSGNALQVNRAVARITFQAQSLGTTTIEPLNNFQEGTKLINQDGIAIPATLNSVTVVLREGGGTTTTANPTTTTSSPGTSSSPITSSGSATSSNGGGGTPIEDLPATGIGDGDLLPLFVGFILVALGVNLSRQRKPNKRYGGK